MRNADSPTANHFERAAPAAHASWACFSLASKNISSPHHCVFIARRCHLFLHDSSLCPSACEGGCHSNTFHFTTCLHLSPLFLQRSLLIPLRTLFHTTRVRGLKCPFLQGAALLPSSTSSAIALCKPIPSTNPPPSLPDEPHPQLWLPPTVVTPPAQAETKRNYTGEMLPPTTRRIVLTLLN